MLCAACAYVNLSADMSQANMKLLEQLLTWPEEKLFPAIDLCKLLVLRPGMQSHTPALLSQILEVAEKMVREELTQSSFGAQLQLHVARWTRR